MSSNMSRVFAEKNMKYIHSSFLTVTYNVFGFGTIFSSGGTHAPRPPPLGGYPSATVLTQYTTLQHKQKRVAKNDPEHADDTNTVDRRDHLRCHSCIEDFCCILKQ